MQQESLIEMKPPIAIDERHFDRLSALSMSASEAMAEVCEYLRLELDRAKILPAVGPDIVSLGSKVEFRDVQQDKVQEVVLVYPNEADIARRRVSVMTPIGAALLGLSANQTITFRTRTGERRELTVLKVSPDR